ncbi:MAG: DUF5615 family PIN-like protein [Desulfurellaceae bacterium]|nr:DUF5615 family PIN-like protein [Desulfurellaceae bacterium]
MRFLADESCDFAVVRAPRTAGHEVLAIVDIAPRADDALVIDLAIRQQRVLLTEDKDFGQLVYASTRSAGGVILTRFPGKVRASLPQAVLTLVNEKGEKLLGHFVVVQPGRIRIGQNPGV